MVFLARRGGNLGRAVLFLGVAALLDAAKNEVETLGVDLKQPARDDPVGLDIDDPKATEIVEGTLASVGRVKAQAEPLCPAAQAADGGRRTQAASSVKNATSFDRLTT